MCRSRSDVGLFVGSCVDFRTELVLFVRIDLRRANHFENLLTVSFRGKDPIFIIWMCYSLIIFCIALLDSLEEMSGNNQSTVKIVNSHSSKIGVVKSDGTNNFDM